MRMTWPPMPPRPMSTPSSRAASRSALPSSRAGLPGDRVLHQLQGDHQPHAADVADPRVVALERFQPFAHLASPRGGAGGGVFLDHHVHGRPRGHHRHRGAPVGGKGEARPGRGDLLAGQGTAHREAVRHPLGDHHDVRLDLPVLDAEPAVAGAPEPGLDFVADEHAPVRADHLGRACVVSRRRNDVAAHPLDGLGEQGGGAPRGRGLDDLDQLVDVAVDVVAVGMPVGVGRDGVPDRGHRRERLPLGLPGQARRQRAASGIAEPQADDLAAPGVHLGQHDRGFDSLGAAVGEHDLVEAGGGETGEPLGRGHVGLRHIEVRGVAQARDLVLHGLDDPRMAVPDRGGEDAGEQVEVFTPIGAPGPHALRLHEHQGLVVQRLYAGEDGGALALDQFPRYHRVITTRLSVKNSTESRP